MTQPPPLKETARQLQIRSAPKPATRINRKLLLAGAGLGALALFAAATFALAPPRPPGPAPQDELLAAGKRKPDGFSALPADYTALGDVPVLGAPFSGDLGATIRAAEQAYGIEPDFQTEYRTDFRPRPEEEAARLAAIQHSRQTPALISLRSSSPWRGNPRPPQRAPRPIQISSPGRARLPATAQRAPPIIPTGCRIRSRPTS